jgi:riboflavin biosynthesis pyrimidine reductase
VTTSTAGMGEAHVRDADVRLRVLILAERLTFGQALAPRLMSTLAAKAQEIRVTVAVSEAEPDEAAPLAAKGIEVVAAADPAWLATRRAQATVVVVEGPEAAVRWSPAIAETQPQAAVVYDPSGGAPDDHVLSRRAETAMLARADVVLAPSVAFERFVLELVPSANVVLARPGTRDLDRALAEALALTGIALPDSALG